jgi:hypothetical protein
VSSRLLGRSRSSALSKKLGGNWTMRNTIAALFFVFASVSVFAAQSNMTTTHEITAGMSGPMCFPGDPCGPQPGQGMADGGLLGPVCYPGDPCGWPSTEGYEPFNRAHSFGPLCFPGDPCGPQPRFAGSMCFRGDPCGPKPMMMGLLRLEQDFVARFRHRTALL